MLLAGPVIFAISTLWPLWLSHRHERAEQRRRRELAAEV
jgi:hypothetical protein